MCCCLTDHFCPREEANCQWADHYWQAQFVLTSVFHSCRCNFKAASLSLGFHCSSDKIEVNPARFKERTDFFAPSLNRHLKLQTSWPGEVTCQMLWPHNAFITIFNWYIGRIQTFFFTIISQGKHIHKKFSDDLMFLLFAHNLATSLKHLQPTPNLHISECKGILWA